MKNILILTLTLFLNSVAFSKTTGGCTGAIHGQRVIIKGFIIDLKNKNTGQGSISTGGRVVADFEGGDFKINFLLQSFKAINNSGAIIEGKITNIADKKGVISKLYIPDYGIHYQNIPMNCWVR
jgi:hypothetical protein